VGSKTSPFKNKIYGLRKGSNCLKIVLRNAANAIGNLKDTALSSFFNRIAYRKGRPAAISVTAGKLAVIIWNMVVKGVLYKPDNDYEFLDQKRKRKVREMNKLMHKFDIKTNELGVKSMACETLVRTSEDDK